jgi:hypothetical protein
MSEAVLFVSFPVQITNKKLAKEYFTTDFNVGRLALVVGRIVGAGIYAPGVIRDIKVHKSDAGDIVLCRLNGNVFTATVEINYEKSPTVETLKADASHSSIGNRLTNFGLRLNLAGQIDGCVAVIAEDHMLQDDLPSSWAHLSYSSRHTDLVSAIMKHIAVRVGIERALLSWATRNSNAIGRIFLAPIAGYRVRRWPVELLVDKKHHKDVLSDFREQFNLPSVRTEVLERAKNWWTVVVAGLTFIGIITALTPFLLRTC